MAEDNQEKKLIIDEDWKQQAQREKEHLLEKERQGKEAPGRTESLPAADFQGLVSMLATQAFFALGLIRTKQDEQPQVDLEMAKYNIDMLAVIQQKTQTNLSDQESQLLEDTLHQLRMAYVQSSKPNA